MNVLVTGANGQLGLEISNLRNQFSQYQFFLTDVAELNITNFKAIENYVVEHKINVLINCAAFTNVDGAEDATEIADEINNIAVRNLGKIAKKHHLKLVHISTDYVFDGISENSYTETDDTNPQNVYGITKLKGEQALRDLQLENSIIIRTSWLYSAFGTNFVKTILKLSGEKEEIKVVNDQVGSPTYAKDLAIAILQIVPKIKSNVIETFHYSNNGSCSWFGFAQAIVELSKHNCKVHPVSSSQFKTKAKRPNYSLLNTSKIQQKFAVEIPNWKDSLKECMNSVQV
ncbi:dTDP-4-dehydrorhamnose reductase [Lutibacter holmesii]|uniref:dTDP-4-dehydrorhamnose reductase n=1 Tax=Lutibacter holmesii TaxID=1137985 RepID=A0ABW3WK54_9FLAO